MEKIIKLDSIDEYNKIYGLKTKHPLITVIDFANTSFDYYDDNDKSYNYELYALFLKQTKCGDITYGRQPYDYQEGTVVSFAPGQVVHIKPVKGHIPRGRGLLFHPDLIRGTQLGQDIKQYSFFAYSSNEALHLSDEEKEIFNDCLNNIETEMNHSINNRSKKLICLNIELLLDYCMRFYERQFITREAVNRDILTKFEELIDEYFQSDNAERNGLPTVKYFAEECFLSPNYFGDLVKKETGRSPQEYIQSKIITLAKEQLLSTEKSISEISYGLGFQYSQHFNRYFKRNVGLTPSEYRTATA